MKARILFAFVVGVLFGVYIGLLVGRAVFSPEVVLRDDGGVIRLKRDQTFAISLKTNPSTGYRWGIVGFDEKILRLEKTEVIRPPEIYPPNRPYGDTEVRVPKVGGLGRMIFRFRAVGQGQTTLKLEYRRSWEECVEPAEIFRVEVTVR